MVKPKQTQKQVRNWYVVQTASGHENKVKEHIELLEDRTKLLSDKFYVGIMNYNGEYHEGVHECFISKDLFQLVQKQLELRNIKMEIPKVSG